MRTSRLRKDEHHGRRLGGYEVLCQLATGGMSQVFLALRRGSAGFRKFAVLKVIAPELRGDEVFLQAFLREARITAALTHPLIPQVFDLVVDQGELCIAMEYVHGVTLLDLARATRRVKEKIPIGLTASVVIDVAYGLHYVHSFSNPVYGVDQVIHRDIAEKNVMVTFDGSTRLLDFGVAKNLGSATRTATGVVKGTAGYMSPEMLRGEPLTPRSDVFSMGVVLHQCFTGYVLFPGSSPSEQMQQTLGAEIPAPSAINPEVPPELDAVVLKALDRDPQKRHESALALAQDLERVLGPILFRPPQRQELVERLFPERRDDWRDILEMVPEEPEVDHTGKAVLIDLLEKSKAPPPPAFDEPWADVFVRSSPSLKEPTEPTAREGPVRPPMQAGVKPPPPVPTRDLPAVLGMDPDAITSVEVNRPDAQALLGPEPPTSIGPPLGPEPPTVAGAPPVGAEPDPATRLTSKPNLKAAGQGAKQALEWKSTAQKNASFVGAGIIGTAIALAGLSQVASSKDKEDPAPPPRAIVRQASGAASSGGGSSGGGSSGGSGVGAPRTKGPRTPTQAAEEQAEAFVVPPWRPEDPRAWRPNEDEVAADQRALPKQRMPIIYRGRKSR